MGLILFSYTGAAIIVAFMISLALVLERRKEREALVAEVWGSYDKACDDWREWRKANLVVIDADPEVQMHFRIIFGAWQAYKMLVPHAVDNYEVETLLERIKS